MKKTFEFTQDCWATTKDQSVRIFVEKGTRITAEVQPEMRTTANPCRRDEPPTTAPTGRILAVAADFDIDIGTLNSCIIAGRCVEAASTPAAA